MNTIAFATWITGRMARHAETEAARNAPAAVACRALETLREALAELHGLAVELDAAAWADFGAAYAVARER